MIDSFDEQVLQHVRALKAIREKFLAAPMLAMDAAEGML